MTPLESEGGGTRASTMMEEQGWRNKGFAGSARARARDLKRWRQRSREGEVVVWRTKRRRETPLFIRRGGARGKLSA